MMHYQLFFYQTKEVCVPSTDYYARSGDWQTETLQCLEPWGDETFSSVEEAAEYLESNHIIERIIILPVYTRSKS